MPRSKRGYDIVKRAVDILVGTIALLVFGLPIAVLALMIRRDGGPALYRGSRVGRNGVPFSILKFRTMVVDADKIGGSSTANDDPRITKIGCRLRRFKADELPQFLNVLSGTMSIVGPRPQVASDVALYTEEERALLSVKPGITDYASIKYRNEGDILEGSSDPDEAYNRLIRPGKSALGLHYVQTRSLLVDLKIMALTVMALIKPQAAERRIPVVADVEVPTGPLDAQRASE